MQRNIKFSVSPFILHLRRLRAVSLFSWSVEQNARGTLTAGTAEGEGLSPTTFIADIYFIGLQLTWKKFRGIIGLLPREEWDVCLSERLQPDVRARIIRCKAQMEWFDFFSALHLGEHHYCHTDNLSPVLQALALPLPPWNLKKKLKRDCSKSSINVVTCYSIQYSQYVE